MNTNQKMFINFLDKLEKKTGQSSLMEAVKQGYKVCFESVEYNANGQSIQSEIAKWKAELDKLPSVYGKTHKTYIVDGNSIREHIVRGSEEWDDAIWDFYEDDRDGIMNVVVRWPNRPNWQNMRPVEFEYDVGSYDHYAQDVRDYDNFAGMFHPKD